MNRPSTSVSPIGGVQPPPLPASLRVDDLLILTGTQQVLRGSQEIPLPKLSFDLLLALVRAAPNTVTLDDLMRRVWPGLVVNPETVTQRVKLLRDALGDDRQAPRYIGLVRGRGYRLLAPVQVEAAGRRSDSTPSTQPAPRSWVGWALGLLLVLATAALLLRQFGGEPPAAAAAADPSVAVLPFATLSPEAQAQDYFAAGIHDDLLTRLAQIDGLRVISRGSVLGYRGTSKSMRQIAGELGVAHLLEGSVQQIGDRVRINVQLIDANTESHLWAQTYDRELSVSNMLDIQAEIARTIASSLQLALQPQGHQTASATSSLEAYRLYLTGNGYRQRFLLEPAGDLLLVAEDHYRRAVAIDPGFALAHAALARTLAETYWQQPRPASNPDLESVRAAAERALQLAPGLAEAHLALANYHYYGFRDYERALVEIAAAERSTPGSIDVQVTKSWVLRRLGRLDDYVEAYARVNQLAPREAIYAWTWGDGLLRQRRLKAAEAAYQRALELDPGGNSARLGLATVHYMRTGDLAEFVAEVAQHAPQGSLLNWHVAWAGGEYTRARAILEHVPDDLAGALPPRGLLLGLTELGAGEAERARGELQRLHSRLLDKLAEPDLLFAEKYQDWLGLTLAAMGERDGAIAANLAAVRMLPVERDAFIGPLYLLDLAIVHATFGETEAAIATLAQAVAQPFAPEPWFWQTDPRLNLVRNEPGFLALVERYGAPYGAAGAPDSARPSPD